MNHKVTFPQIVESLIKSTGCTTSEAEQFLHALFQLIADTLANGKECVEINGIGTFQLNDDSVDCVTWIPDPQLADALNQPFAAFEPVVLNDGVTEEILDGRTTDTEHNDTATTSEPLTESHTPQSHEEDTAIIDDEIAVNEESSDQESVENDIEEVHSSDSHDNLCEEQIDEEQICESCDMAATKPRSKFIPGFIAGIIMGLAAGYAIGYYNPFGKISDQPNTTMPYDTVTTVMTTLPDSIIDEITDTIVAADTIIPKESVIVYDTISTSRYLATMARKYYGDFHFWVYIYEENADRLRHPDHIRPGTVVVIPPAEKYGIDASDPESVRQAGLKMVEIYSRFD